MVTSARHESAVSLRDLIHVALRHRKKIILFVLGVLIAGVSGLLFIPPTYVSEAKLFVRVGRETITLDPTVTTGETLQVRKSENSEINSILEILESQAIAKRVVKSLGPNFILNGPPPPVQAGQDLPENALSTTIGQGLHRFADDLANMKAWLKKRIRPNLATEVTDHALAVEAVMDMTSSSARRESMVVNITSKAHWPEVARRVLETLTTDLPREYSRLCRTEGSFRFFEDQTAVLFDQLKQAEQELRDRKNEFGLISIEGKRANLESVVSNIVIEGLRTDREISASEAKIGDLERQLQNLSPTVVTSTVSGMSNPARDGMRQQLYDLEIRERELLAKYAEDHFLVKAVQQQRGAVREILESELAQRTQTSAGPNPNYQALELDLKTEQANLAAFRRERNAIAGQDNRIQEELRSLNEHEIQIAQLQRQVDAASLSYRSSLEKLEEARLEQQLGLNQISSLNVIQPATEAFEPASPSIRVAAALILAIAFFGSLGVVVAAEVFDTRLKSPQHVRQELDLPILACVPQLPRRRALLFEKRRTQPCLEERRPNQVTQIKADHLQEEPAT